MESISSEESTVASVGYVATENEAVCPFCGIQLADRRNVKNHIKARHKGRSMSEVALPAGHLVCVCGAICKGEKGLRTHRTIQAKKGHFCVDPDAASVNANSSSIGHTPQPVATIAAPPPATDLSGFVDLKILVAELGVSGLYQVHPAWRDPMLKVSVKLIKLFENVSVGREAQAAFLLLPAITRRLSKTRKAGPWLRSVAELDSPSKTIIHEARSLASMSEQTSPRHRESGFPINIRRRSEELYRGGQLRAVMRMITEAGRDGQRNHPNFSQHQNILRTLHPEIPPEHLWHAPADLQDIPVPIELTNDMIREMVEGLPRDKAKGVSGWSYAAIKSIFLNEEEGDVGVTALRKMFLAMVRGKLDQDLWMVSRSVLIPKGDTNTYRPLAIGDPFYRILGKVVMKILQPECEGKLSPIQLGCGVSGGTDKLGRIAQVALEENPQTCVISLDIANAFGHISREDVYSSLVGPFEWLRRLFVWAYGKPVPLSNSKGEKVFEAEGGILQGDSFSSLFFCLAFQPVLEKIQTALALMHHLPSDRCRNGYSGQVMAFIDDVNLLVLNDKVDEAISAAENILQEHGLPLNAQKTVIIRGSQTTDGYSGEGLTRGTSKIVGVPVGHSLEERMAILEKTKERVARELEALKKADVGLYIKFNLLRSCINTIPGYLTRVCEPTTELTDFAHSIDTMVDEFLFWLIGTSFSDQEKLRFRFLRELPQRLGGLGIGRHSGWFGEKACLLSRHLTRQHVWKYFSTTSGLEDSLGQWRRMRLDQILDDLREKDSSIGSWWDKEHNWVSNPDDDQPFGVMMHNRREFEEQEKEYGKEVRTAVQLLYTEGQEAVMRLLGAEEREDWQAWLLSSEFRGSGRFLAGESEYLCGEFKFTKDDAYLVALRMRCTVDSKLPATSGPCPLCGTHLTERSRALHLGCCEKAQWFFKHRHDAVRDQVSRFLTSVGIKHEIEENLGTGSPDGEESEEEEGSGGANTSSTNTQKKKKQHVADIVYYPGGGALPVLLDITVSHPSAPSYNVQRPHERADAVACRREEDKIAKYQAFRHTYNILPFVVEATGRIGPMARTWMRDVSEKLRHQRTAARARIGAKVVQFFTLQMIMMGKAITFNSTTVANTPNAQTSLGVPI